MLAKEITIINKNGLHARPAAIFSAAAAKFRSKILIKNVNKNSENVNAKSIVRVLTLGITQGTTVQISADGEDEEDAMASLFDLINGGFGET